MPRDQRERVQESDPVAENRDAEDSPYAPGEEDLATTGEAGERNAAYNKAMRDYAPPFVQPTDRGNYVFTQEDLIRYGMSNGEIIKLQREGAAAGNGGLREYDEEAEERLLNQKREQASRLAVIDGGDAIRSQLSTMEAYFAGAIPNGAGDYCKRYPYVSPTDETVGVNGYIFQIPKYRKVMLPEEVLIILNSAAMARQQYDILSAIYTARQHRPLDAQAFDGPGADAFAATVMANHHVKLDLIPGNFDPTAAR